jgi:hypothetical protein
MAGLCFDLSGIHPNIKIQRVAAAMPDEQPPWKSRSAVRNAGSLLARLAYPGGTGLRRSDGFFVTVHEKAPVGA